MPAPIIFHFDFSSPYGYIASEKIDALAAQHGRDVIWRPYLLGAAFKATGGSPLPSIPLKGPYHLRDFPRSARYHGVPYRQPGNFPISTVPACRAFYWLDSQDPRRAKALATALLRAYFVDDIDISGADNTIAVGVGCGLDAAALRAGINDPAVKERLKAEVDQALGAGAFGSPHIIIDGEPFWGADRLAQIERWLATGGF